jgi:putative DNA methylase
VRLEDVTAGASLQGVEPSSVVTVVAAIAIPPSSLLLAVWEALHQLIRALRQNGESGAGRILAVVTGMADAIRQLSYPLCERRGLAEDARPYNGLVTSRTAIETAAGEVPETKAQINLFGGGG